MTTIKRIKGGTDNCYLITDGTKAILVDTASKQCLDQVIAECDKYEMKLIVLTHVHFDHAENAAELSKKYGIPVAVHPKDEELFDGFEILTKEEAKKILKQGVDNNGIFYSVYTCIALMYFVSDMWTEE